MGDLRSFHVIIMLAALAFGQSEMAPPAQSVPVDQENARRARAVLDQTIQEEGHADKLLTSIADHVNVVADKAA